MPKRFYRYEWTEAGWSLTADVSTHALIGLDIGGKVIQVQLFTKDEFPVLLSLLNAFPQSCPYGDLVAAWWRWPRDQAHQIVINARHNVEYFDSIMRPIGLALHNGVRTKLQPFGFTVQRLDTQAYQLIPV